MENPELQDDKRNQDGTFKKGVSGNPNGRPKGKTLKDWAREFLMSMSDEEKADFLDKLPKEVVWKMAEGNPHQDSDITSKGERLPHPIYVQGNDSPQENSETKETN